MFSRECFDCQDTLFSSDCRNCHHIFGCVGLRNKSYYIFNKPVPQNEYEKFLKDNSISSYKNIYELNNKSKAVRLKNPHRSNFIVKATDIDGNFIHESKKSYNVWNVKFPAKFIKLFQWNWRFIEEWDCRFLGERRFRGIKTGFQNYCQKNYTKDSVNVSETFRIIIFIKIQFPIFIKMNIVQIK